MKKWQKKERRDEEYFAGRRVKASGSKWYEPGDVRSEVFLVDSKQTDKKSYSVSRDTWNKICEEAALFDKIPLLSLDISGTELIVIGKDDFKVIRGGKA